MHWIPNPTLQEFFQKGPLCSSAPHGDQKAPWQVHLEAGQPRLVNDQERNQMEATKMATKMLWTWENWLNIEMELIKLLDKKCEKIGNLVMWDLTEKT